MLRFSVPRLKRLSSHDLTACDHLIVNKCSTEKFENGKLKEMEP